MDRNPIFIMVPTEVAQFFSHDRHVFCPNYDSCLDEAIEKNLFFDCGQCLFKLNDIKNYKVNSGMLD